MDSIPVYGICLPFAETDAVRVPVALLVLEGGPGTLNTVVNAIKNNTPAIVIKVQEFSTGVYMTFVDFVYFYDLHTR